MERGKLGNAIRSARMARGISQEELAELLDVTTSHLKHIESEHRKPSIEVLFRLATLLDLSLDELLFPEAQHTPIVRIDGLTPEEVGVVTHLVKLLRNKKIGP